MQKDTSPSTVSTCTEVRIRDCSGLHSDKKGKEGIHTARDNSQSTRGAAVTIDVSFSPHTGTRLRRRERGNRGSGHLAGHSEIGENTILVGSHDPPTRPACPHTAPIAALQSQNIHTHTQRQTHAPISFTFRQRQRKNSQVLTVRDLHLCVHASIHARIFNVPATRLGCTYLIQVL